MPIRRPLRRAPFFIFAALTLAGAGLAHAQQKTDVIFSAGPTGGSWTPMAAAASQVINKRFPDLNVQVEPGAALVNLEKIRSDKTDIAWSMTAWLADARSGVGQFEGKKTDKALFVAYFYPNVWQLVVPASSNIKSVKDGAGLWRSGVQAMKFAAAGFIVPYFFVYNPALLFAGEWHEILRAVVTGSIGVVALAASMEGYFLRMATWFERLLLFAAALLLIDPNAVTDIVGLAVLGGVLLMQKVWAPQPAAAGGASP